jgi:DNA-binding NtrC family response regulator
MFLPEPDLPAEVLVVDDDCALSRALEAVLRRDGYPVVIATNSRAAMDAIARHRIVLVISDIFMPEGDGLELLNFLRQLNPRPPIVAMSGAGVGRLGNILEIAGALGAARILPKPFAPSQLLGLVRELIGPPVAPTEKFHRG